MNAIFVSIALVASLGASAAIAQTLAVATAPSPTVVRTDPALDALIAPDAAITLLAKDFVSTEGPLWLGGRFYVSDQKSGDWWTVAMDGAKTRVAAAAGGPINPQITVNQGPNGSAPWKNGAILLARQGVRDIGLYKNGRFVAFVDRYEGKHLNAPNDMVVSRDGAVWFTDPPFSLPGGIKGPNQETPFQGVYRRAPDGKLTLLDAEMTQPNGIALSPDEKTLYVSDYLIATVYAYDVARSGAVSNKRVFARFDRDPTGVIRGSTDGMKVDAHGNVWTTMPGGVAIITPQGKMLGRLQMNAGTTNVGFGGPDGKSLFITSGGNVFTLHTRVRGKRLMYAR